MPIRHSFRDHQQQQLCFDLVVAVAFDELLGVDVGEPIDLDESVGVDVGESVGVRVRFGVCE
jgi:hypothetical protein